MKKILSLILAVAMCATLFAGCGTDTASSDLAYIKDKGEMVIGMTLFAPMNYYNDANEFVGFETEFAKAVCEKLGVEAKFVEIDWNSKEIELNAKNIDCIWNGMTITEERKANMDISTPYMKNRQVMVVKAENLEKYSASVAGATVVAEAGSAGEELAGADEFFKEAKFTPVDSMAKALMDVKAGTSDVAIVDYVTSIGSIGEGTDFADLVAVEALEFSPEEYGIAFRKGGDTATAVNEAIAALIADGKLEEIAKAYKLENLLIK
ncbi:MAG: transporter substrate-binding domain-containing protein [Clostridia bacterium]|nr:transporter substrate-binding domain-containing protein [Clostridia bacterium]